MLPDGANSPSENTGVLNTQNGAVSTGPTELSLPQVFRSSSFWLIMFIWVSFAFSLYLILTHIVPHATDMGISPEGAAGIISLVGGASIVGNLVMGTVSDRLGRRETAIICSLLLVGTLLWLIWVEELWMFYLFAAVFGFAWGGQAVMVSPLVAELFGLRSHGAVFGAFLFIINIVGALGPLLAGGIFDITGSYDWAFLTCTVVSILGFVSAVLLKLSKKT